MERNVPVLSSKGQREPVAMLTGMPIELMASYFATRAPSTEIRVETLSGFRLVGIVEDATRVELFTRNTVPVRPRLWIAAGTDVSLLGSRPGALHVEKHLLKTQEPLRAWANCASLALDQHAVERSGPPKGARAYLTKERHLTFFRSPSYSGGEVISLTAPAYSDGLLLWGTQRKNEFVRAYYQDEIVVEAWVPSRAIERIHSATRSNLGAATEPAPNLEVRGEARLFVSRRTLPIRVRASKQAPVVGFIEPRTEVLVTDDKSTRWAAVLPKNLAVTAPNGANFWVPAREVQQQ